MKINKLIIAFIMLGMFSFSGCQKYLDLDPLSKANGEQIWGTASGTRQLLAGTYSLFRRTLLTERPFYLYGDLPSQTVLVHNHWIPNYAYSGNYAGAYLYDWWVDWTPYYQIITTASTILNHIDDLSDTDFNEDTATGHEEKMQIKPISFMPIPIFG